VDALNLRLRFALDHANGSGDRKVISTPEGHLPEARSRAWIDQDLKQVASQAGTFADNMVPVPSGSAAQVTVARV
jgi:hypothetical protein